MIFMSSDTNTSHSIAITGVPGFDEILGGGLPSNRIYLVQGAPGAGKTTMALQFLLEGVQRNEPGLYITLSETRDELISVSKSHGWSLDKIALFELSAIEQQLKTESENTFFRPSEVELNRTTQILLDEVERVNPARIVFDSLSELRLMSETPLRFRRQMLSLKQFFAGRNCTVLFLDDQSTETRDAQVESIAHGVISLDKTSPDYGISRRTLTVEKIRGLKFREGRHDFIIKKGGMVIFPRLVASEHRANFKPESFSSGIAELDALLGGGLDRGTSNMFMGPPGTGKSTLAMRYAFQAVSKGERVKFFTFDETIHTLVNRAESLGMNIGPHLESGLLTVNQVDPAEISPGEMAYVLRVAVEEENTRMVIIDSINGYMNAMPAERFLNLQLHELLSFLSQQGVITIMVLAQQGLMGHMQASVDLTYLADTVLLYRYFEAFGEVHQALSVIKKRSGNHERTIREFRVNTQGIKLGPPLREFQGVLTGVPTFKASDENALKVR